MAAGKWCRHWKHGREGVRSGPCVSVADVQPNPYGPHTCTPAPWVQVERAKKCLDFASTCYIFHFCFSWRYDGFPTRFEWWVGCWASCGGLLGCGVTGLSHRHLLLAC